MPSAACARYCGIGTLVLGVLLLAAGLVFTLYGLPAIIESGVRSRVPLRDGGDTSKEWATPTYDVRIQFYLFDTVNAEDFETTGATPHVVQKGPYGFKEVQVKNDISWSADGNEVSYHNNKTYYFDPDSSCDTCLETDTVTIPNLLLMTLYHKLPDLNDTVKEIVSTALRDMGEKLFVTRNVIEVIMTGYDDPLLDIVHSPLLKPWLPKGLVMPERIGIFYGLSGENGTSDAPLPYTIRTGVADVGEIGKIVKYNGSSSLPESWWTTEECRTIKGTDGTMYKPFMDKHEQPDIFVNQLCRSLWLRYKSETSVRGVPGYFYSVPAEVFAATDANKGYCPPGYRCNCSVYDTHCLTAGLLDITRCQPGNPPIIVSSPHFLFCPAKQVDTVLGLEPNLEEHETIVKIEPTTGVGMEFGRKLQINLKMDRDPHFRGLQLIDSVVFPILWLNESAVMSADVRDMLQSSLLTPKAIGTYGGWTVTAVGALLIMVVIIGLVIQRFKSRA